MFSVPLWSAFTDTVTLNPIEQAELAREYGLNTLVLRNVWGRSVETLTNAEAYSITARCAQMGVSIHSIATTLGGVNIENTSDQECERLRRALELAQRLQADAIRIHAFRPPHGGKPASYMGASIARLKPFAALAQEAGIKLLVENAPETIGNIPSNIHTVVHALRSPWVQVNWNTGHFVQAGIAEHVIDYWLILARSCGHITLTDALLWDHSVCLPGDGDAQVAQMLMMLRAYAAPYGITLDPCLPGEDGFALTLARVRQCSLLQGVMA
jgi:sugar phosphate isomerase/epimerase